MDKVQRKATAQIQVLIFYSLLLGKNTHSRYVANIFLFWSPRPSLLVLPSIHEIPVNYDKSITDGRRHFVQVNRLIFFFFFLISSVIQSTHLHIND